jgi:hypothetical protein
MTKMTREEEELFGSADQEGWQEVETNQVKLVAVGDSVTGKLLVKDTQEQLGVGWYTILTKDGEKGLLGSAVLDTLLKQVVEGSFIRITLTGFEETANGKMKVYKVQIHRK